MSSCFESGQVFSVSVNQNFVFLVFCDAAEGEDEFFFGLATAPAHVEDRLNDAWLQFAEDEPRKKSYKEVLEPTDALMGAAAGDGGSQQAPLPSNEVNKTKKKRKPVKLSIEAMIRGFQKYIEVDEGEEVSGENEVPTENEEVHHKVTAWHNVPHP